MRATIARMKQLKHVLPSAPQVYISANTKLKIFVFEISNC